MFKPRSFTSVPKPEVHPPPVKDSRASSSTQRETRSSAKKRNADQIAKGEDVTRGASDDSNPQEASEDAQESSQTPNTKPKRARKSAPANSQASVQRHLHERIKDLEGKLKAVTKESVLNARRGAKGAWDHGKIETEFKNVKRDVKNWVKKYGTTKKLSTFSDTFKKDILSACTADQYQNVFSEDNFGIIQELPKGAQLLLEGFLYAQSNYNLIIRPFLFIDAVLQEHSHPSSAITAFGNYEKLFEEFADSLGECKAFPDQAQRWIASVLQSLKRMIIPDPSDDTASNLKDEKLSSDPYRIYELGISQLATEFLHHSKPVKHLLGDIEKKETQARHDDLKKIYRKFRELAYHMWCQPSTVYHCHELCQFDPTFMELDPAATHGRQDMDLDKMKGSKVLIRLCPLIWGGIMNPINNKEQKVVYLTQKVWTVDCQTYAQWKASQWKASQWKASQNESTSEGHPNQTTSEPITQNDAREKTGDTSIDDRSAPEAQIQEFKKDTDDTTASPPDANCDAGPDLPRAQEIGQSSTPDAEQVHSASSPDTDDAMKHDDLDAMEEE